jgi:hypothetical protein
LLPTIPKYKQDKVLFGCVMSDRTNLVGCAVIKKEAIRRLGSHRLGRLGTGSPPFVRSYRIARAASKTAQSHLSTARRATGGHGGGLILFRLPSRNAKGNPTNPSVLFSSPLPFVSSSPSRPLPLSRVLASSLRDG